jgi:hypothetical protein
VTELKGKDFIALRRLSDAAGRTLADVGETCERVPASSLPGLLAHGAKIAPAPKAEPSRRKKEAE